MRQDGADSGVLSTSETWGLVLAGRREDMRMQVLTTNHGGSRVVAPSGLGGIRQPDLSGPLVAALVAALVTSVSALIPSVSPDDRTEADAATTAAAAATAVTTSQLVEPGQVPDGLTATEWADIQRQIAAAEAVEAVPATVSRAAAVVSPEAAALSSAPQIVSSGTVALFGTTGAVVSAGSADPADSVSLRTNAVGDVALGATAPAVVNGQAYYLHTPTVTELYRDTSAGLQQLFTIAEPVTDGPTTVIAVQVGSGTPTLVDSQTVVITATEGTRLRYRDLIAWDATGAPLTAAMDVVDDVITLNIETAGARYPITVDPTITEHQVVSAPPNSSGERAGSAVAIGDNVVAVSSPGDDDNGPDFGKVDVYSYDQVTGASTYSQSWYGGGGSSDDDYGYSVAIGGNTLVVGAPGDASSGFADAGAIYTYIRAGAGTANFAGAGVLFGCGSVGCDTRVGSGTTGARFGESVAVDATGTKLVVGAPGVDAVYVIDYGTYLVDAILTGSSVSPGDNFGASVDIGANADYIVAGAPLANSGQVESGLAFVFEDVLGTWTQVLELNPATYGTEPNGRFGAAVAVSDDSANPFAVVAEPGGAGGAGTYFIHDIDDVIANSQNISNVRQFGGTNGGAEYALTAEGEFVAAGAPGVGANGEVVVHERTAAFAFGSTTFAPAVGAGETGAEIGADVSLTSTGALAVGIPGLDDATTSTPSGPRGVDAGQARMYNDVSAVTPIETATDPFLGTAFDEFGYVVDLDGNRMAVSAIADSEPNPNSGVVHIFERDAPGAPWNYVDVIRSPIPEDDGYFGESLDLFGDRIAIGEPDSLGDEADAGRVFVFERQVGGEWTQLGSEITRSGGGSAGDEFGYSVAFVDTDRLVIGSPGQSVDTGGVYATAYSSGWAAPVQLTTNIGLDTNQPGDRVGHSVAAATGPSGTFAVAGAPGDDVDPGDNGGAIYVFEDTGSGFGALSSTQKIDASSGGWLDFDGVGSAVDTDGLRIVAAGLGDYTSGQAFTGHAFEVTSPGSPNTWGRVWEFRGTVPVTLGHPVNDYVDIYGGSIALGRPGGGGQVGVFRYDGTTWPALPDDQFIPGGTANGDRVGSTVALDGRTLATGASGDDLTGADAGTVFEVEIPLVATFTGAVDSDYETPGNWDVGVVPLVSDAAVIPAAATVEVSGYVESGNLMVLAGAQVNVLDAGELAFYQGWSGAPSQIAGTIEIQSGGKLSVAADNAVELVGGTIDNLDEGVAEAFASDGAITIAGSGTWNNSGELRKRGSLPVAIGSGITWNSGTTSTVFVEFGDIVFEMPVFEQGTVQVQAGANVSYVDDFSADSSATILVEIDGPPPSFNNYGTLGFSSTSPPGFGSATLRTYGGYTPADGDVFDVMSCYECGSPDLIYDIGFLQPAVIGSVPGQTLQLSADVIVVDTLDGLGLADGFCSLREAITAANSDTSNDSCAAGAGADTIVFAVSGTIPLTSALPPITTDITIDGIGQSIVIDGQTTNGSNGTPIARVNVGATASFDDLTFSRGRYQFCDGGDTCGAVLNYGTLNVSDSTFASNQGTGNTNGIAITNRGGGQVTIDRTTFNDNVGVSSGAVWNASNGNGQLTTMTITNSTFTGNSAGGGAAIYNTFNATLDIANSTFVNNTSATNGTINNAGGGSAAVTIANSTFVDNNGSMTLKNGSPSTMVVRNTIITETTSGAACSAVSLPSVDTSNIDTDGTCGSAATSATLNLQPLADNGGPTETVALGIGSSALGAGDTAVCAAGPVDGLDQRGQARGQNACNVGAFDSLTAVVNSTGDGSDANVFDSVCETAPGNGVCTLRAAIEHANASTFVDYIEFDIPGGGVQTITPGSALPFISDSVVIDGLTQPGADCSAWPPTLNVEFDLSNAGPNAMFLAGGSDASTVRGLVLNRASSVVIALASPGHTISCNFIGTDPAGNALTGTTRGVWTMFASAGSNTITDNLFASTFLNQSMMLGSDGNVVQGNYINVTPAGVPLAVCCLGEAIAVSGSDNLIGGVGPGEGNLLGAYAGDGVDVFFNGATGNTIRGNSVVRAPGSFPNAIGIDLSSDGGDGVTPNDLGDADTGENNLQNYPVVASATEEVGATRVVGSLNSNASRTFDVDVYSDSTCQASGHGDGESYLGSFQVTTDGAGNAAFDESVPVGVAAGSSISTTATDTSTGDTSEFSACVQVASVTANKIESPVPAAGQQFGFDVDIDGDKAVVSAAVFGAVGSVYVFAYNGGTGAWDLEDTLVAPVSATATWGSSVGIAGDIVGVLDGDRVHIFSDDGAGNWSNVDSLVPSGHAVGSSAEDLQSLDVTLFDGTSPRIAVSTQLDDDLFFDNGALWVFEGTTAPGSWTEIFATREDVAAGNESNGFYGVSVAMDDDLVVVGAPRTPSSGPLGQAGTLWIYRDSGAGYVLEQRVDAAFTNERLGMAVGVFDGTVVSFVYAPSTTNVTGTPGVAVFEYDGASWNRETTLTHSGFAVQDNLTPDVDIFSNVIVLAMAEDDSAASNAGLAVTWERPIGTRDWSVASEGQVLQAGDASADDRFGRVAVGQDSILVGALGADTAVGADAGAIYAFPSNAIVPVPANKLEKDVSQGLSYGSSVDIEGDFAAASAPGGVLQILRRDPVTGRWQGVSNITPGGGDVAMSPTHVASVLPGGGADAVTVNQFDAGTGAYGAMQATIAAVDPVIDLEGDLLIIGEPDIGQVRIYEWDGLTTWTNVFTATGTAGTFGYDVAIDGDAAIVSDTSNLVAGSVLVYQRVAGAWQLTPAATLTNPDTVTTGDAWFGSSVDIAGTTLVIGHSLNDNPAGDEGAVWVYEGTPATFASATPVQLTLPSVVGTGDVFGQQVQIDGNFIAVGAQAHGVSGDPFRTGAAFIFNRFGSSWVEVDYLLAPDRQADAGFGASVAVWDAGTTARSLIGAPADDNNNGVDAGAVYFYESREFVVPAPDGRIYAPDAAVGDYFGQSVDIHDDWMVVGARNGDGLQVNSGTAYVFRRNTTTDEWVFVTELEASDATTGDWFGQTVAISGTPLDADGDLGNMVIAVGAPALASLSFGAVYLYRYDHLLGDWIETEKIPAPAGTSEFGFSVDLEQISSAYRTGTYALIVGSPDVALVGAPGTAHLYSYTVTENSVFGDNLVAIGTADQPNPSAQGLHGVSVAVDGDSIVVGESGVNYGAVNDVGQAHVYSYTLTPAAVSFQATLEQPAADRTATDNFGRSVSIDGDLAVVAGLFDRTRGVATGAAYVYRRSGSVWGPGIELVSAATGAEDNFGLQSRVEDGVIAVSSFSGGLGDSGTVQVFRFDPTGGWIADPALEWQQGDNSTGMGVGLALSEDGVLAAGAAEDDNAAGADAGAVQVFDVNIPLPGNKFTTAQDIDLTEFGGDVDVDDEWAIVGAVGAGSGATGNAYMFRKVAGEWQLFQELGDPNPGDSSDEYGVAVAVGGDFAVVADQGDDHVFWFNGTSWTLVGDFYTPGFDNYSIDLDIDGANDRLIVGYGFPGAVTGQVDIYDLSSTGQPTAHLVNVPLSSTGTFYANSVSIEGDLAFASAERDNADDGSVVVFERVGTTWSEIQSIAPPSGTAQLFGSDLDVDGDYLVVGQQGGNRAWMFENVAGTWTNTAELNGTGSQGGRSVSISGDIAVLGSPRSTVDGLGAGSADVFARAGDDWLLTDTVSASDREFGDAFGASLSLDGSDLFVGAPYDTNDDGVLGGAAYVYEVERLDFAEFGSFTFDAVTPTTVAINDQGFPATAVPKSTVSGETSDRASVSSTPLRSVDLNKPVGADIASSPIASLSLGDLPLLQEGLTGTGLVSPLDKIPLTDLDVSVKIPNTDPVELGGWEYLLAQIADNVANSADAATATQLLLRPLQNITFSEVKGLDEVQALKLEEISVAGTPIASLPIASLALGSTPIASLPLEEGQTPVQAEQAWCDAINSLNTNVTCGAGGIDPTNTTLMELTLVGVPIASLPIASLPIASLPIASLPIASLPIASLDVGSTPIASLPIASLELAGTPIASLPIASLPIASLPIASLPIASLPIASLPIASLPIASLEIDGVPIASLPIASLPIASLPIASLEIQGSPIASLPIASLPIASLPIASLPIASLPIASLPIASLDLSGTPIASLPIASLPIASLPIASLTTDGTLRTLPIASLPIASLPIASLPIASLPIASLPIASLPIASLDPAGTPIASLPIASLPIASLDPSGTPIASLPIASLEVQGSPIASLPIASLPIASLPIASLPIASLPIASLGGVVDCSAIDCTSPRLSLADALNLAPVDGATFGQLLPLLIGVRWAEVLPVVGLTERDFLAQLAADGVTIGQVFLNDGFGDLTLGELPIELLQQLTLGELWDYLPGLRLGDLVNLADENGIPLDPVVVEAELNRIKNTLTNVFLGEVAVDDLTLGEIPLSELPDPYLLNLGDIAPYLTGVRLDDLLTIFPGVDEEGLKAGFEQMLLDSGAVIEDMTAGEFTIGDLLSGDDSADLTLGELLLAMLAENPNAFDDITFGDLLLAFLAPSDYPWEKVAFDEVDTGTLPGVVGGVTFEASFSVTGTARSQQVQIAVEAPGTAGYLPGTATLDSIPITAEPLVLDESLVWTLTGLAPDVTHVLSFQVQPTLDLGDSVISTNARIVGTPGSIAASSIVTVNQAYEPNDLAVPDVGRPGLGQAYPVIDETLYLTHIADADDIDFFKIDVTDGQRVVVNLSGLDADFDVLVYGQSQAASIVPLVPASGQDAGVPLEDPVFELDGTTTVSSEVVNDAPVDGDLTVVATGNRRGVASETVVTPPLEAGTVYIQVFGANSASSLKPAVLQVRVTDGAEVPPCSALNITLDPLLIGTPFGVPVDANTLILVNNQRLEALYPNTYDEVTGAGGELEQLLTFLAANPELGIVPGVLNVDQIGGIGTLYDQWDADSCDPVRANDVVAAITAEITAIRAGQDIEHVMIIGGDDVIPMARVVDGTKISNEYDYRYTFGTNNAIAGAAWASKLLTDEPYGDSSALSLGDRFLYITEAAIGRLIESPTEIAFQLDQFETSSGVLNPTTGLVMGYDFLDDGSVAIADDMRDADLTVDDQFGTFADDDTWTSADVASKLGINPLGVAADIISLNAHFDHRRLLPALGNQIGSENDLFEAQSVFASAPDQLTGRVTFSMGCHSGLNVADLTIGNLSDDFPQAFSRQGGIYVGNTGYGYGDTDVVAYSERLMELFAEELLNPVLLRQSPTGTTTAGQALQYAKNAFFAELGVVSVYDEKVLMEATFYGIPFYRVGLEPDLPAPTPTNVTSSDPVTGTSSVTLASSALNHKVSTPDGDKFVNFDDRGNPLELKAPYNPAQPLDVIDVSVVDPLDPSKLNTLARGVMILGLESTYQTVNPYIVKPIADDSDIQTEPDLAEVLFPSKPAVIRTTAQPEGTRQSVALATGQYRGSSASGTQRLDSQFELIVYYSDPNEDDFTAPVIRSVSSSVVDNQFSVTVEASDSDGSGNAVDRVYVLVAPDPVPGDPQVGLSTVEWLGLDLVQDGTSNRWVGSIVLPAGTQSVEFIVQAKDAVGNVGYATNKAGNFTDDVTPLPVPPAALLLSVDPAPGSGATQSNGWYNGPVVISAEIPGVPLRYRRGIGPIQPVPAGGIPVSAEGSTTLWILDVPDEPPVEIVVRIDTKAPTATVSPVDQETIPKGAKVLANFSCKDPALAECTATISNATGPASALAFGTSLAGLAVGAYTIVVSATDAAGNSAQVTSSFAVVEPDTDGDGVIDIFDNCPNTPNADQLNGDNDSLGDACDDATPPVVTGELVPALSTAGWTNNPASLIEWTAFDYGDDSLGPVSFTVASTLITQGITTYDSPPVCDNQNNCANGSLLVQADFTDPEISGSVISGQPGTNGWYTSNVTVGFSCADNLSGVALCEDDVELTEGADQTVNGDAFDVAGNAASTSVNGIDIDTSVPTITATLSTVPVVAGWSTMALVVSFICTDGVSGIASCTAPVTVYDGAGQSVTGTAVDLAGNEALLTVTDLNVDATAPVITAAFSVAPNSAGWFNEAVTLNFTCSDTVSMVTDCPGPLDVVTEGEDQEFTVSATDNAGNSTSSTFTVSTDFTDPDVQINGIEQGEVVGTVPAITCVASDDLSGIDGMCEVTITAGFNGDFTASATATDMAGNSTTVTVDYRVLAICDKNGAPNGASACVVPFGTVINGNIKFDGEVVVLGEVTGHVKTDGGTITVGATGIVGKHIDQKGFGDVILLAGSFVDGKVQESGSGSVFVDGTVVKDVEEKDGGDLTIGADGFVDGKAKESGSGSVFVDGTVVKDVEEQDDGHLTISPGAFVGGDAKERDDGNMTVLATATVDEDVDSSGDGTCTIESGAVINGNRKGDCQ